MLKNCTRAFNALRCQALELIGFHLGAVLLALEAALRLFVLIERALNPRRGAVEKVDLTPERLARIKRRAVPDECFRDKGLMSRWIDGNK